MFLKKGYSSNFHYMLVFFIFFFVVCHEFKKGVPKMKFSNEIGIENSYDHNAMIKIIKIGNRKI